MKKQAELFPLDSIQMDSPRRAWLLKHDIHTKHSPWMEDEPWAAWVGDLEAAISQGGDYPEAGGVALGWDENDALCNLAKARGLRLWNEQ